MVLFSFRFILGLSDDLFFLPAYSHAEETGTGQFLPEAAARRDAAHDDPLLIDLFPDMKNRLSVTDKRQIRHDKEVRNVTSGDSPDDRTQSRYGSYMQFFRSLTA